jgi:hypothetical protein
MHAFYGLVRHLPDIIVLAAGALSTAALALVFAYIARKLWFKPREEAAQAHTKLSELVHGSLLAFAVFVLAIVLSDVRENFGKADDATSREASVLMRLDRDLRAQGASAEELRTRLRNYVETVINDEWPMLGSDDPELSPRAEAAIGQVWDALRSLEAQSTTAATASLRSSLDRLEEIRQTRLEHSSKSVPNVFWWMISVFLAAAMAMNGRYRLDSFGVSLIGLHMAGIGMVLALILVMDEPFRGQSAITAESLAKAVGLPFKG